MNHNYNIIRKHLVSYTCGILGTKAKEHADLLYAIIFQALDDSFNGNNQEKRDALEFFQSEQYKNYCLLLALNPRTMNYIIHNPEHVMESLRDFRVDDDESNSE